jgi:hypothetical protein
MWSVNVLGKSAAAAKKIADELGPDKAMCTESEEIVKQAFATAIAVLLEQSDSESVVRVTATGYQCSGPKMAHTVSVEIELICGFVE